MYKCWYSVRHTTVLGWLYKMTKFPFVIFFIFEKRDVDWPHFNFEVHNYLCYLLPHGASLFLNGLSYRTDCLDIQTRYVCREVLRVNIYMLFPLLQHQQIKYQIKSVSLSIGFITK
jgi:hypothetical protein